MKTSKSWIWGTYLPRLDQKTKSKLIKEYQFPDNIAQFIKKNWPMLPNNKWYSENWELKVGK